MERIFLLLSRICVFVHHQYAVLRVMNFFYLGFGLEKKKIGHREANFRSSHARPPARSQPPTGTAARTIGRNTDARVDESCDFFLKRENLLCCEHLLTSDAPAG